MADLQLLSARCEQGVQPRAKGHGTFKKIRNWLAEAQNLHTIFNLMRRQLVVAQHIEQSAAGKLEQGRRKLGDMGRGALAGRETVKSGVEGSRHA